MKTLKIVLFIVSLAFSINISAQTVYTTKTGEKYHTNSCRYLKHSKYETTIKKAKTIGYTACKVCKPSTNNTSKSSTENSANTYTSSSSTTQKKTTATQCTGKTKAGNRCKRKTKSANGRCYQH